ncbi:MAG TPA: hypothetical protein VNA57_13280 [Acidimicrobiales bacterium]|nr:hypothetical protein [Acidimicrobiales bacterium]
MLLLLGVLGALAFLGLQPGGAGATHVTPTVVAGNPTCSQLGYGTFELKVDPVPSGTYARSDGVLTVNLVVNAAGDSFDWTSNIPVLAVVAKGGDKGNVYVYNPAAKGDTGLQAPDNSSGSAAGLSHISFCYDIALEVTKTAQTSLTRTWDWTVDKSSETTSLNLSKDQSYEVSYDVELGATSQDSNHAVAGTITIKNPAPAGAGNGAIITSVTDTVSPAIAATVQCPVTFPHTLAPGATLTCTYSAALPDAATRTNTATATVDPASKVKGGSGTAAVSFANATATKVDECVKVTDDKNPAVNETVCANDLPETITYKIDVGKAVSGTCGEHTYVNTAKAVEQDTKQERTDPHTVVVTVNCAEGCSLTPGYWKNHADPTRKQFDDTWLELPAGPNTPFFNSGKTYLQALNTSPGGNAYWILAHAYIAAELNGLNGADTSAITQTMADAKALLQKYTPTEVATFKGNNAERKKFIDLALTLDKYNNGLIGPGHCDEDTSKT